MLLKLLVLIVYQAVVTSEVDQFYSFRLRVELMICQLKMCLPACLTFLVFPGASFDPTCTGASLNVGLCLALYRYAS